MLTSEDSLWFSFFLFHHPRFLAEGNHIRQDSMEPSDLWDDVSNCWCEDRLKTLEQQAASSTSGVWCTPWLGRHIALLLCKGTPLWSVSVILFKMPVRLVPTLRETQLKVINWENTSTFLPRSS